NHIDAVEGRLGGDPIGANRKREGRVGDRDPEVFRDLVLVDDAAHAQPNLGTAAQPAACHAPLNLLQCGGGGGEEVLSFVGAYRSELGVATPPQLFTGITL